MSHDREFEKNYKFVILIVWRNFIVENYSFESTSSIPNISFDLINDSIRGSVRDSVYIKNMLIDLFIYLFIN